MKPNNTNDNLSGQAFRSAKAIQTKGPIQAMAVCLILLALALSSMAQPYVLTGNDGAGTSSFNSAGLWSPHVTPGPGTTNITMGFDLRTPADGNPHIFLGDSLTLSNAVSAQFVAQALGNVNFVCKGSGGSTVTVTNLIMLAGSGIGNANNQGIGQICWVAGNISVQGTVLMSDVNTAPRYVGIASTLSGTGAITNECFVIYSGNNVGFTGPQIAVPSPYGPGGTIIVTNEAALGGNPSSFNAAQLNLNGGTLHPAASFALDHANAGVTIGPAGGFFDIISGLILTNSEPLAGTGNLQLTNAGTMLQVGSGAGFTGTLTVNNGDFALSAANSLGCSISPNSGATFDVTALGSSGLSLASGKTLAGNGTVTGSITAGTGSFISPGGNGTAAALTISGNLTLSGGATLQCDFLATNDVIAVGGNLTPSGTTTIQLNNIPAPGTYTLMTVAGTLGGSPTSFRVNALSTRTKSYTVIYNTSSSPNLVQLQVISSGSAANLIWRGDVVNGTNNMWDIVTTSNWVNSASTSNDVYYDGDTVSFTDSGATNLPTLNVTVNPAAIIFNSSSNYSLTISTNLPGTGGIAGPASLIKGGTGTLTLAATNSSYIGGTLVTNGVLQIPGFTNAGTALGLPSGATPLVTVTNNGTFNINGAALDQIYTNVIQINGNGFSATQGAIDNTGGGLTSGTGDIGISSLALTGNSTVSCSQNWQIGLTGQGLIGNGFALTRIGNNFLYFRHAATSAAGSLTIIGPGGVLFWDHPDGAGLSTPITLTNGGFIDTWNPGNNFSGLTFYNPITVNDAVNGGAILNRRNPTFNRPPYDIYNGNISLLNGSLLISNVTILSGTNFGHVTLNGNVSGPGGIIAMGNTGNYITVNSTNYYPGNLIYLNGINSFSGPTLVTNFVDLLASTASQGGGSYDLVDYGTLDVAVAPSAATMPISSLTLDQVNNLGTGQVGFTRLAGMPAVPVIYATNLVINGFAPPNGGFSGNVLPPVAGYSIGQFPLIGYSGTIGGSQGFAGLALATLPAGVTASLVNDTGHNTIDLNVTTTGIEWKGNVSSNWDMSALNWYDPTLPGTTTYQDGQTVVFDNTASQYLVNITQTVAPSGVTINGPNNYTFSTSQGGINGSAALIMNGTGTLTVACTNNNFTGGTYINSGTLQLADQNFVYPYGGGALNNNLGNVTVANGGTLDINGVQVPNYQSFGPEGYNVFLSGSGVGGNGALINSSTNDNDLADPGYVTLAGNATVGGIGDVNIRHGVSPQLSSQSGAYTLTKVGPNQFRIRYVTTVSTNFGTINILQGIVSYESSSTLGLGDPTKNILVGSGGGFAWGTIAAQCVRPLICSNNSTLYGYNITNNVFNSPVTLVGGNVNLNANFYNGMIFSNVISGAGGVTLQGQSRATFAAANTYSGNTTVMYCNAANGNISGSILTLVGNGSINNSPSITLLGILANQAYPGALDASGRVDGTLTLVSGQSLRGDNGSFVRGNVTNSAGATITPGGAGNIQYMTFSNNLTLLAGSTVAMDVSISNGIANDVINVAGTNNYGGTLQLTNSGATALTNGAAFALFNNAHFSGNFASISGSPGPGLGWIFNPTNGIATVVATTIVPTNRATITQFGMSGQNALVYATNGQSGGTYYLLSTTNLATPRNQWIPVATNVVSTNAPANGFTFIGTNVISPGSLDQFYILSNTN